ncbi:mannose-6-phosphate isomerase, class I [Actinomycetospora cinnamomea]|uniref:mannose-6-phosphate isomerase n=1 Tax=Actinomycetospora cinnamomea TaxID=663609 RepID=A0A2U1FRV2_9PSEU|nr:mannose-6-phosphate isomerase, class I [Actinomycetospora cinnamomea]PVZ14898.1 mannose-6-phosphate isomerase type 1 [Actinomycetospora cinnamomea]
MEVLRGSVRTYTWGSRTHLAELLGEEVPSPHPQAELWLGAHRDEPSRLNGHGTDGGTGGTDGVRTLTDVLAADPLGTLGPARRERWSGRLPYLLKVLAAEEPLSLQAHPSAEQAAAGYAREEAAGVPRTAAERNYPDPLPKPEILCALTEFHALAGFRPADGTVRLLRALDVRALDHHTELLAAQPDADGLRALFTTWITLPQRAVDELVPALLEGCVAHVRERGDFTAEARTLLDLGERYPGDAGVLAALLLNRVSLAPGQCLYQPAGSPHSYLSGCGVELMANSDNVLRCGLTPKHVDVPELLRVLDFAPGEPPLLQGDGTGAVTRYAPSEYFSLARCAFDDADDDAPPDPVALGVEGPRIAIAVAGSVRLRSARGQEHVVARGTAAWVPACDGPVTVEPVERPALAFVAADGLCP